jgi:hypothetical protein
MVSQKLEVTRRARLQGQRGAAVFIVVMVLTLLTAMGIFAVRSASMADVAAGFDREGAQASLVAQYGVSATAALLGTQGLADTVVHLMESTNNPNWKPPTCDSNVILPAVANPNCFKFDSTTAGNINTSFIASSNESIFAPSNAAAPQYGASSTSSLNANELTDAAFVVELTEARSLGLPAAGSDLNNQVLHQVTITSIAQVRPVAACATGTTTPNAAQTAVRSIITVGVTR